MERKRTFWTEEEEELLCEYVKQHGLKNLQSYNPNPIPGLNRSAYSCQSRWSNFVRPGSRYGRLSGKVKKSSKIPEAPACLSKDEKEGNPLTVDDYIVSDNIDDLISLDPYSKDGASSFLSPSKVSEAPGCLDKHEEQSNPLTVDDYIVSDNTDDLTSFDPCSKDGESSFLSPSKVSEAPGCLDKVEEQSNPLTIDDYIVSDNIDDLISFDPCSNDGESSLLSPSKVPEASGCLSKDEEQINPLTIDDYLVSDNIKELEEVVIDSSPNKEQLESTMKNTDDKEVQKASDE